MGDMGGDGENKPMEDMGANKVVEPKFDRKMQKPQLASLEKDDIAFKNFFKNY